jgi:hypothetical protein
VRRQNVALTIFLLGPLIVLVILYWLIVASVREAAQREMDRDTPARVVNP